MKEILLMIWEDLKKGRNFPHYATIAVALGVAILRLIFGSKLDPFLPSLMLATLGLLLFNSVRDGHALDQLGSRKKSGPISVYPKWNDPKVWEVLETAREEVILFQSFFPDAVTIADHLLHCSLVRSAKGPLRVDIFMLDPLGASGGQRVADLEETTQRAGQEDCRAEFSRYFEDSRKAFIKRLGGEKGVDLRIFAYSFLPTLKLYSIDNRDFLFGWLGARERSTQNVCLRVSSENSEAKEVVDHLRWHRDAVAAEGRQVWPGQA